MGTALAHVKRSERLSDLHLVHLTLDGTPHEIVSAAATEADYGSGQLVSVDVQQMLCFDSTGSRIAA
jgi:multiple sugar transport system ATP-binding protein